jgi:glucose-6-phosphate isomerase
MLGGRFSVLSSVGLFPAAVLGMDVEGLVAGAQEMARRCATAGLAENPAYRIGAFHHFLDVRKKKSVSVMMPYADALSLAADWYAQLWAESLGKDGRGQTVVKSLGATDQHSQIQLFMEGPRDKAITFLKVESFRTPTDTTTISSADEHFSFLNGKDLGTVLRAEQEATSEALARAGQPNLTITFPTVDAHHAGEFFMLYEIATAFTGALYGINPFDQPGVELGKKLTREILSRQ